jgi:hypothetical protein
VILFFIDESGNTGAKLDHAPEPIHWLVALAVPEQHVRPLDEAIASIATGYFGNAAGADDFEFKGAELFAGKGLASSLAPARRVALYGELLRTIGAHGAGIFVRGIDKPQHRVRALQNGVVPEHPYIRAFQYLVESMDVWLEQRGAAEVGLIIADQQQEVDRRLVHKFSQWSTAGTDRGWRKRRIVRLVHTIHYVRSTDSRLIQLADCAAFIRNRCEKIRNAPGKASDEAVLELWRTCCLPHVVEDRIWP